jgi:hypothetical protein
VQITVVRDSQGRLLELESPSDQVVDPVRAVEERVLGVAVEVYEGHREEDSDPVPSWQRKREAGMVV